MHRATTVMRTSELPKKVGLFLAIVALMVYAAAVLTAYLRYFKGHNVIFGFFRFFHLNEEANFPTWYSSFLLLISSVLLLLIAYAAKGQGSKFYLHWVFLALIFFFLSVDEIAQIHEMSGRLFPVDPLTVTGLSIPKWVFVYAPLVAVLAFAYRRFLLHLSRRIKILLIAAALLYVGGALGVEALSGHVSTKILDPDSFQYVLFNSTEEMSEIFGVVLLNYALLTYFSMLVDVVEVRFRKLSDR